MANHMNFFLTAGLGGIVLMATLLVIWFVTTKVRRKFLPDRENAAPVIFAQSSWEEKRTHPRFEFRWPASIETPEGGVPVETKDVSMGGAFILCEKPWPLNEEFRVTLQIPNQDPLTLTAEVVWSNCNVPADKVVNRGMGIRFVRNTPEVRQRLLQALGT
jgi:hypothetical protein